MGLSESVIELRSWPVVVSLSCSDREKDVPRHDMNGYEEKRFLNLKLWAMLILAA
jgi:hypothetical protein